MRTSIARLNGARSRCFAAACGLVVVLTTSSVPLGAQSAGSRQGQPTAPGWVFTPGVSVAESWDNNVLLSTEGSETAGDFLTAISPRAALGFRGRRSTFQVDYRGSFQLYQQLTDLNAYDQRSATDFRVRLSPRLNVFARNSLSKSPTTDDVDLPGITFRRQGVLLDDFRAGVESRLNARTNLETAYTFQWVHFEELGGLADPVSQGGYAHGAVADLQHVLTPRVSVGGEFEMRHAIQPGRVFDIQNALATVDVRLSERLQLSGGAGYSWLAISESDERQSAPALRASLSGSGRRFAWDVSYRQSFLPSFGFGGTFQNQELVGSFLAPLSRRLDWSGSVSWRQNDPLNPNPIDVLNPGGLRSVWARTSVSYLATRWMRIEGFYNQVFQDSQRPGGKVDRTRLGVQVVTAKRMRIR
jgi:hypothetical protein